MDFVEGHDREQMFISSIEQMVDPEAFVRIIDAFIDALPLEQFDFKNLELNEQGDRKSTRLNSSHNRAARMPSSA